MRSGSRFEGLIAGPELDGASTQSHRCSKFSYSRDFLLSLGRTERCKFLPRDFDPSILHESEDASTGLLKTPFDLDSRHSGSLSRGLRQNPFSDGLLGSGGCMATASSKIQSSNGYNLLTKSAKPYRPPHFYKVMSHSGKEGTDSCNMETSGSDFLSSEKAKEGSKRDSFQLMKKDQHQAIQEKHNKTLDEPKSEDCGVPPASYGGSANGLLRRPILSSISLEENSGTKSSTKSSSTEVAMASDSKEIQAEKCSEFNDQLHETSNENSEELNQLPKPAMIQEEAILSSISLEENSGAKSAAKSSSMEVAMASDSKEIQSEKCSEFNDQLHETSNGNSEESNQFPKRATIQEAYTCKDLEQSISPEVNEKNPSEEDQVQSWKVSDGEEDCLQDLKLSSDQSKISSDKLHPKSESHKEWHYSQHARFESCLPHNLISSRCNDQVDLNKNKEHNSVSDDTQPAEKAEFTDEYDLPDEDSLFNFDYSIEPQDSSPEAESDLGNHKSGQLGLGNTTFHHNPLDAISMETYNIYSQQGYLQVPYLHPQGPQQGHRSSKTKKMNPRPYPNNWCPIAVPLFPLQPPPFQPAMLFSPFNHPHYDHMPFPISFPPIYHGMPNPGPGFGPYNNQVPFNQPYKNGNPRNQTEKALANRCRFGKQW